MKAGAELAESILRKVDHSPLPLLAVFALLSLRAAAARAMDAEAFRLLQEFWGDQKTTLTGKLGSDADPGFVFVTPPDSSLWAPGSLLLVTDSAGITFAGSRETVFPAFSVSLLGSSRSDVAVLDDFVVGRGGVALSALPGILEGFGLLRAPGPMVGKELELLLKKQGVQRLLIAFPDAQIHRLGRLDVELYLSRAPDTARRLLDEPGIRMVSSSIFVKTVQLRFDPPNPDPAFKEGLEALLGTHLTWKAGAAEWQSRGLYVAIQTMRYVAPAKETAFGGLTDTTAETRAVVENILPADNGR